MTDGAEASKTEVSASTGKRRAPTLAFVSGAILTLVIGSCIAVPLVSDSIATGMARTELEGRGLSCTDVSVDVNLDFSRAEIAPMRCGRGPDGEVEAIELVDPAFVDLVLFSPTHLTAGRVRVHLRADDPGAGVDLGALGPVAGLLHIPSRIASAAHAAAEIASHDLPPTDVSSAEIVRGENVRVSMTDLTLSGGTSTTFTIARVDLPALEGPFGTSASVAINTLTGDASPSTCTLSGELQLDASIPLMEAIHRRQHTTITATGLDTPSPSWNVSFE